MPAIDTPPISHLVAISGDESTCPLGPSEVCSTHVRVEQQVCHYVLRMSNATIPNTPQPDNSVTCNCI